MVAQAATAAPQKSGADGEFKLDVQALGLREGDQIHLIITGEKGGKGEFLVNVLGDAAAEKKRSKSKKLRNLRIFTKATQS